MEVEAFIINGDACLVLERAIKDEHAELMYGVDGYGVFLTFSGNGAFEVFRGKLVTTEAFRVDGDACFAEVSVSERFEGFRICTNWEVDVSEMCGEKVVLCHDYYPFR